MGIDADAHFQTTPGGFGRRGDRGAVIGTGGGARAAAETLADGHAAGVQPGAGGYRQPA